MVGVEVVFPSFGSKGRSLVGTRFWELGSLQGDCQVLSNLND